MHARGRHARPYPSSRPRLFSLIDKWVRCSSRLRISPSPSPHHRHRHPRPSHARVRTRFALRLNPPATALALRSRTREGRRAHPIYRPTHAHGLARRLARRLAHGHTNAKIQECLGYVTDTWTRAYIFGEIY
jgi:hypothetical protein